jgi:predicted deacylase
MQRRVGRIRIDSRLAEQTTRPPVLHLEAPEAGPTVVVAANIHGDECTGVLAIHALDAWLQRHLVRGRVHLYPSLNPSGLAARTRGVGFDGADLNRMFPGDANGGAAERLAYAIWRDVTERSPDMLIDLHSDSAVAIPYAIVDRPVALRGPARLAMEAALVRRAEATGLTVLRDYPSDQYQRFGLDRSLAGAMVNKAQVAAVTIEAGPRRIADFASVDTAVCAVQGVLAELGLVVGAPPPHPSRVRDGTWRRSTALRSRAEGLFVPTVPPGQRFAAGQIVGEVRGLSGDVLEQVRASDEGIVVSWLDTCWVAAGASVGTLGIPDVDPEVR